MNIISNVRIFSLVTIKNLNAIETTEDKNMRNLTVDIDDNKQDAFVPISAKSIVFGEIGGRLIADLFCFMITLSYFFRSYI